jgi:transcriptional regulator with XRE-family HTH domain
MEEDRVNGLRIRQLRESKNWLLSDLAKKANLSVAQIMELENGGSRRFYSVKIKQTAARKLARVFEVADAELFCEATPSPVAAPPEQILVPEIINPGLVLELNPADHAQADDDNPTGNGALGFLFKSLMLLLAVAAGYLINENSRTINAYIQSQWPGLENASQAEKKCGDELTSQNQNTECP